jgi:hypothetical protein
LILLKQKLVNGVLVRFIQNLAYVDLMQHRSPWLSNPNVNTSIFFAVLVAIDTAIEFWKLLLAVGLKGKALQHVDSKQVDDEVRLLLCHRA